MNQLVFLVLLFSVAFANVEENSDIEDSDLFEGDIKLTDDQRIALISRGARSSMKQNLWPGAVIVYEIDSTILREKRAMEKLNEAIAEYHQLTCLRFRKKTASDKDYVLIYRGPGCWSSIGKRGGKQRLSLSKSCWHKGTIIHELAHALGFYHEQTRPDRDNYVTIMFDNIRLGMASNFMKHSAGEIDSLGTPYDYGSIMHYGRRAFSINRQPTIVSKTPGVTFGQRNGLSPIDIKQMNLLYKCNGVTQPPHTQPPITQPSVTLPPDTIPPVTQRPVTQPPVTEESSTFQHQRAEDFYCDFDRDYCGFVQLKNDKFDWRRQRGRTSSSNTGPSSDHTTGRGSYVYIETSQRRPGDNAKLEKPGLVFNGNKCLTFYYHMYGATVGSLIVRVGGNEVFRKTGDQGDLWKEAEVKIKENGVYSLVFEGVRGKYHTGDIAIDDISLRDCSGGGGKPVPPSGSCGIRPNIRIVGGTTAKQGSWPWQAQIRTKSGFPYCGGTLIHPEWVLTATHCLKGESASRVYVRLGAHRRRDDIGTEQDFKVVKLITHPNYHRPVGYAHDIALLKLERPAQLNKNVNIVCLPDGDPEPSDGKRCYITGWGKLSSSGSSPNLLQQAVVPIVSRARCKKAYSGQIHESMICAGLDKGGVDACQGDSGGPMVCENGGRFYIHGATSWGSGCAAPGKFGVYARVKYLLSWVRSVMARP